MVVGMEHCLSREKEHLLSLPRPRANFGRRWRYRNFSTDKGDSSRHDWFSSPKLKRPEQLPVRTTALVEVSIGPVPDAKNGALALAFWLCQQRREE
jgi:hypothetical protein